MESAASKEAGRDLFSWSGFPAEWVKRLRQRFSQPLVPLELLDSPEGFEDVLNIISGGDVLQGALLRGRLQEFREGLPHRKRIVQAQSNAVFKKPRLPTIGSDSAHMQEAFAISANALMPFKRKHGKSGLGKALLASEEDPDILETRERDRWVEVMSGLITEAQLPVVALIEPPSHFPLPATTHPNSCAKPYLGVCRRPAPPPPLPCPAKSQAHEFIWFRVQ